MRFSMIDLVIAVICMVLGFEIVIRSIHLIGGKSVLNAWLVVGLGILAGMIFFLTLGSLIYGYLRLRPLFLPVCPHCKRLPHGYRVLEEAYPRSTVGCGHCGQTTELWWMRPKASEVSTTTPSLLLSWPQSIGRWRLISRETT